MFRLWLHRVPSCTTSKPLILLDSDEIISKCYGITSTIIVVSPEKLDLTFIFKSVLIFRVDRCFGVILDGASQNILQLNCEEMCPVFSRETTGKKKSAMAAFRECNRRAATQVETDGSFSVRAALMNTEVA